MVKGVQQDLAELWSRRIPWSQGRATAEQELIQEWWHKLEENWSFLGKKRGINYHPWSPVTDMPTRAHPFYASSVHGHFLEFKPSISLWIEALPTCPTTNSYCFSWCSGQRLFVMLEARADFAASLNDLVSHRISWVWRDPQGPLKSNSQPYTGPPQKMVKGWTSQLPPPPLHGVSYNSWLTQLSTRTENRSWYFPY